MKLKPIGICDDDGNALCLMKASDFSDGNYEGIQLRRAKDGMTVIITKSRKTAPLMWRVVYGFSEVYFRTFSDAVEFCNSRGMEIMKGQVE